METKLQDLGQFTGTEVWYKHSLAPNITYTEGARYVAMEGGAYWLLDEIAFGQMNRKVQAEEFQVWTLVKDAQGSGATLMCGDGNHNQVFRKHIPFTDFPLHTITLWFTNNVILLPSEY